MRQGEDEGGHGEGELERTNGEYFSWQHTHIETNSGFSQGIGQGSA